jgi:hypothetical protein
MYYTARIVLLTGLIAALSGCSLWTGKGVVPGRTQGMATITVTDHTQKEVETAIHAVFIEDGFKLAGSAPQLRVYERPANRLKDLSYGGLGGSGVVERAFLEIHDEGSSVYRIECNVAMVTNNGDPFYESDTEVLKLFAGQYRRLLRRIPRRLD